MLFIFVVCQSGKSKKNKNWLEEEYGIKTY